MIRSLLLPSSTSAVRFSSTKSLRRVTIHKTKNTFIQYHFSSSSSSILHNNNDCRCYQYNGPTYLSKYASVLLLSRSLTLRVLSTRRTIEEDDDWYADYDPSKYNKIELSDTNDKHIVAGDQGRASSSDRRGSIGQRRTSSKKEFGPNGHDYTQSAPTNNSIFTLNEIHSLLSQRLQSKLNGDYETADDIQRQLIDGGVYVHDKLREWRGDGKPYPSIHDGGRSTRSNRGRNIDEHNEEVYYNTKSQQHSVVNDRRKKRSRSRGGEDDDEYNNEELYYNTQSEHTSDDCDALIDKLCLENIESGIKNVTMSGSSSSSDDDHVGNSTEISTDKKEKRKKGVYIRRGGGNVSSEDEDSITKLLMDRYNARRQKNYDKADEIYTKLLSEYNIKIDDRSNEWHCIDLNNPYARRAGDTSAHISDEDVVYIDNKLKERFGLKREKQYEDADAIRDKLKERFNVKIDDRTKEWFVDS